MLFTFLPSTIVFHLVTLQSLITMALKTKSKVQVNWTKTNSINRNKQQLFSFVISYWYSYKIFMGLKSTEWFWERSHWSAPPEALLLMQYSTLHHHSTGKGESMKLLKLKEHLRWECCTWKCPSHNDSSTIRNFFQCVEIEGLNDLTSRKRIWMDTNKKYGA